MATLVANTYYLDDWDKISSIYKEYVDIHSEKIDSLEKWMRKEPHLPSLTKPNIGMFLKISNGSCEVAKEAIDAYFSLRLRYPEIFMNRIADMKRVEQTLDIVEIAAPDPWIVNHNGYRLTQFRLVDTDASKLDFRLSMQVFTAGVDFELARVGLKIKGLIVVFDMTGFHLGFIPRITLVDLATTFKYITVMESFIHEVHIINCNSVITQVMALIRPLLSKTLMNKIHFHSPHQMDEFFKMVPKSFVSSTYGGELESMTELNDQFRKRFRTAEDWLKSMETQEFQLNESLRRVEIGKEKMTGTFRKLAID